MHGARPWAWFALLCVFAAVVHVVPMSGTTFYVDEWTAVFEYDWSPSGLLTPVNGHNATVGRTSWYLVMALFGTDDYLPYRLLGLAYNLFTAAALFAYCRSRHSVLAAGCVSGVALALGSGFHTVLWPASAIGLFSMGALPLCLLLFARQTLRATATAVALLLLALGTGAMGLVVLGACFVELALRRRGRQLAALGVPALLYLGWLGRFGDESSSGTSLRTLLDAPAYAQEAFSAAAAGLLGLQPSLAATAAGLYLIALSSACYRNQARVDWPRMAAVASAALAFWGLTAAFRGSLGEAGAPRYIAFGALPLALLLVEATRGLKITRPGRQLVLGVTAVSIVANLAMLLIAQTNFRYIGDIQRAQLAALELVRPTVDPDYIVPGEWARYVHAGDYFRATDRFGSPALPRKELARAIPAARAAADEVLAAGGVVTQQPTAPPATTICSAAEAVVAVDGGEQIQLGAGVSPVGVRLQQLGDGPAETPAFTIIPGSYVVVNVREDGLDDPWRLHLDAPAQVCPAR